MALKAVWGAERRSNRIPTLPISWERRHVRHEHDLSPPLTLVAHTPSCLCPVFTIHCCASFLCLSDISAFHLPPPSSPNSLWTPPHRSGGCRTQSGGHCLVEGATARAGWGRNSRGEPVWRGERQRQHQCQHHHQLQKGQDQERRHKKRCLQGRGQGRERGQGWWWRQRRGRGRDWRRGRGGGAQGCRVCCVPLPPGRARVEQERRHGSERVEHTVLSRERVKEWGCLQVRCGTVCGARWLGTFVK